MLKRIQACPAGPVLAALEDIVLVILFLPDFVPKQPPRPKSLLSVCLLCWLQSQALASASHLARTNYTQLGAQHVGKRASCQAAVSPLLSW